MKSNGDKTYVNMKMVLIRFQRLVKCIDLTPDEEVVLVERIQRRKEKIKYNNNNNNIIIFMWLQFGAHLRKA